MDNNSGDEIETRKIEHDQNTNSDDVIKSNAVVKYSNVQAPVRFKRLEFNTDLNMPPSNWLCTTGTQYGIYPLHGPVGFASFRMAHMFSDCLEDVDVVSDAENIKRLLKLPYSQKTVISMLVHKVGNTLLLDEFDIQKFLLRKSENDWNWLHKFISERLKQVGGDKTSNICIKDKSREAVHRRNLLSKFLYYTLQRSLRTEFEEEEEGENYTMNETQASVQSNRNPLLPLLGPILPEPNIDENVPDPNSSHVFNRNIVWTFEDIRMLIGTDMPIFGGATRPCVSLRLRDMTQPINILTGIDYWLDNLMCNVPEVVMCYHIDGIVQKYELIKTEDLPFLEDSQFSPQIIRNVAQNILAFLKSNATKAGHTYWLFKGKNDDVVKLYDLTTLCENDQSPKTAGFDTNKRKNFNTEENNFNETNENPFTISVAMLLYSVARNLRNTSEKVTSRKAGSIKALLDNCLKLLPKEKYPQIVTSSRYMLSDLYIPAGLDPKSPNFTESDSDTPSSVYEDEFEFEDSQNEIYEPNCGQFQVSQPNEDISVINNSKMFKELSIQETISNSSFSNGKYPSNIPPAPLIATLEERCKIALEHISEGLSCLQYFLTSEEHVNQELAERLKAEEKRKIIHEEQNPNMAKQYQPIPLPYESLNPEPKTLSPDVAIPMGWEGSVNIKEESNNLNKKFSNKKKKGKMAKHNSAEELDSKQELIQSSTTTPKCITSWNVHLKVLLLEKACLTYVIQAEHCYVQKDFGKCLKCLELAFKCQDVDLLRSISNQKPNILERAGDIFFQIVKQYEDIDKYLENFKNYSEDESHNNILKELEKGLQNTERTVSFEPVNNIEQLMLNSCDCYEKALEITTNEENKHELIRKLGSVKNELGLKYMYCAQEEYARYMKEEYPEKEDEQSSKTKEPRYQLLAKQSFDNLIRAIWAFEKVHDNINLAYVLCNTGRFMRFRAHIHMVGEEPNDMKNQKRFYHQAFSYYERTLGILENRKSNPELWDLVCWDLSTATFMLAKQVQDWSSTESSSEEVEKEIVELLQKSLKLCDTERPGSRQVLYTYRSGLVHQRLGSFYHSQLRKLGNSFDETTNSKTTLQLSRLHYEKSAKILETLKETQDFLTVQLERIGLQEFLTEISNKPNKKIKCLQYGLEICLQSKTIFMHIIVNDTETNSKDVLNLLNLFLSRLQFLLKNLTKLNMRKGNTNAGGTGTTSNKITNNNNKEIKKYAEMYNISINAKSNNNCKEFAQNLINCLNKINEIYKMLNVKN